MKSCITPWSLACGEVARHDHTAGVRSLSYAIVIT
jgi:hypothetical protein